MRPQKDFERASLVMIFVVSTVLYGLLIFSAHYLSPPHRAFLFADYDNLLETIGGGDAGYYLRGGNAFAQKNMEGEFGWVLNLWPPGMVHIYALIISAGLPIGLSIATITVGVYGATLTFLFRLLQRSSGNLVAAFGWVLAFLNPFAVLSLGPTSLLYSDGLGASFLALAVLSWLGWVRTFSPREAAPRAGIYGIAFAVASVITISLRWALVPVIFILWFLVLVFAVSRAQTAIRNGHKDWFPGLFEILKPLVIAIAMAMPWTIYVSLILHPPNPLWSIGTDYVWQQRWLFDEDLPGFLVSGNANWACDLNPERCSELRPLALSGSMDYEFFRDAAVYTAVSKPLEFVATGLQDFFYGFFTAPFSGVGTFTLWQASAVSASLFAGALFLSFQKKNVFGIASILSVLLPVLLILTVFHVEARYLLPLHYLAFTVCIYLLGRTARGSDKEENQCPGPDNF